MQVWSLASVCWVSEYLFLRCQEGGRVRSEMKKDAAEFRKKLIEDALAGMSSGATQRSSHTKPERVEVGQRWSCPHGAYPEYVLTRWTEQLRAWEASPYTHWTPEYLMAECTFLGWAPGFGPDCQLSAAEGRSNSPSPGNTWEVSSDGSDWAIPKPHVSLLLWPYRRLLSPEGRILEEHGPEGGAVHGDSLTVRWPKHLEGRAEPGGQRPQEPVCQVLGCVARGVYDQAGNPPVCPGHFGWKLSGLLMKAGPLTAPEGRTQTPVFVTVDEAAKFDAKEYERIARTLGSSIPTPVGTEKTEPVKVEPRKHDFSDPYCAGPASRMCVACGAAEPAYTRPECTPAPDWRERWEKTVAERQVKLDSELSPADCGPSQTLPARQSQAIGAGLGVWSLREEGRPLARSQEVGRPKRPWELP